MKRTKLFSTILRRGALAAALLSGIMNGIGDTEDVPKDFALYNVQVSPPLTVMDLYSTCRQDGAELPNRLQGYHAHPPKGKIYENLVDRLRDVDDCVERLPYYALVANAVHASATLMFPGATERNLLGITYAKIKEESRFTPRAVSSSGAVGLLQVIDTEVNERLFGDPYIRFLPVSKMEMVVAESKLTDPARNLMVGVRMLAKSIRRAQEELCEKDEPHQMHNHAFDEATVLRALMEYAGPGYATAAIGQVSSVEDRTERMRQSLEYYPSAGRCQTKRINALYRGIIGY